MHKNLFDILQDEYHAKLSSYISDYLLKKQRESSKIFSTSHTAFKNLIPFCISGKFLRGSMVLFICNLFQKNINKEMLAVAGALEIIHSSFLIHDDIMDQDTKRRGSDSLYIQYNKIGTLQKFNNPNHFGISAGICIGDLGYFLGFELLSLYANKQILTLCSKEFSNVTLAQLDDVYNGFSQEEVSQESILSLYQFKTGRYTFSVPFVVGGILAGVEKNILKTLENVGENFGVLFQLKDDELGIFGQEAVIGKSIGGDIRENKKTFYRQYIFSLASNAEKNKLNVIFGNKNATEEDIRIIRELIEKYSIKNKMSIHWNSYSQKIEKDIQNLPVSLHEAFFSLMEYNKNREK